VDHGVGSGDSVAELLGGRFLPGEKVGVREDRELDGCRFVGEKLPRCCSADR
jgi:hypothetical protein